MSENTFEVVFLKRDEIVGDATNTEFQVTFGEALVDERNEINELRRLAAEVAAPTTNSFMTS